MIHKITALLFLFLLFSPCALAQEEETYMQEQFKTAGGGAAADAASPATSFDPDFDFSSTVSSVAQGKNGFSLKNLMENLSNLLFGQLKGHLATCGQLVLLTVVLSMVSKFLPEHTDTMETAFFVCYTLLFTIAARSFQEAFLIAAEAVDQMSVLMRATVPLLAGLTISSGGIVKTGMFTLATTGLSAATLVVQSVVMPLCSVCMALSCANNLSQDITLRPLYQTLKKLLLWVLGILATVFTALVSLSGMSSSALTGAGGKAIKYTANLVPVVGSMLSASLDSVMAYGKVIKSATGVAGILAVLYIGVVPIVKLGCMILSYRLASCLMAPVGDSRLCGAVDDIAGTLTIINGCVIAVTVMFTVCMGIAASV